MDGTVRLVTAGPSLHGFFVFLDCFGGWTFARADLERALGGGDVAREILRALKREEIVAWAPNALMLECTEERARCRGHEIREEARNGRPGLVGICTAKTRRCLDFPLDDETFLARITVSIRALALTLRRLFDIEGLHDLENEQALMTVGEEDVDGKTPRNVHLLASPDYQSLTHLFARLGEKRRRSLVLIPVRNEFTTMLRERHGPETHVELAFLEERLVLRNGALAAIADDNAQSTPRAELAIGKSAPVTLVFECERAKAGSMRIVANGKPVVLQDRYFAFLIKLVDIRLTSKTPNPWTSGDRLGADKMNAPGWHVNRAFDGIVPDGFDVVQNDGKKQFALNPAVVIGRIDWSSVAAHPHETVKAIARRHAAV